MTKNKKEYSEAIPDNKSFQMNPPSPLVRSARFYGSYETRKYEGSELLSELCPMSDGYMLPFEKWVHHDDLPGLTRKFDELSAGKIDVIEHEFRTDYFGSLRYCQFLIARADGAAKGTVNGVVHDMTEVVSKRKTRAADREFWEASFDSMPALFFVKDADDDFRYLFANRAFCGFTRKNLDEIIGKTDKEIIPDRVGYLNEDIESLHSNTAELFENEVVSPDGDLVCFHTLKWRRIGHNGHKLIYAVGHDVTSHQLMIADLKFVNDCVPMFSNMNDARSTLRIIIELLCEHLGAARGFIVDFDREKKTVHCVQEYVAHGQGTYLFFNDKEIPFTDEEVWYQRLVDEHFIAIPNTDAKKTETQLGWHGSLLRAAGAKAIYASAICGRDSLDGAVCFGYNDVNKRLSAARMEYLLTFVSRLIQNMRSFEKQKDRMKAAFESERRSNLALQVERTNEEVVRYCLETMLREIDPAGAGVQCLKRSCEHLAAPRGFFFQIHTERQTIELKHEYSKNDHSILTEGTEYPYIVYHDAEDYFHENSLIMLPKPGNTLRSERVPSPWKEIIDKYNWSTLYARQIEMDGHPFGFFLIVFENVPRYLGEASRRFIESIARCFEHLQERSHIVDAVSGKASREVLSASDILADANERKSPLTSGEGFAPIKLPTVIPDVKSLLQGRFTGITDISLKIRNEQITNRVLAAVAAQHDFNSVIKDITAILTQLLGCNRMMLVFMRDGRLYLHHEGYSNDNTPLHETEMENHQRLWTILVEKLKTEKCLFCDDLLASRDAEMFYKELPNSQMRAFAACAIHVNNEFVGFLDCIYNCKHQFRESDKAFLQSMCNIIALTMVRERQNQVIHAEREENQAILDNIDIPLWLFDRNGVIIRINKAGGALAPLDQLKHAPRACRELIHCGKDDSTCPVKRALRTCNPAQGHLLHKGREYIITANPILNVDGQVVQIVKSFIDVTELINREKDETLLYQCLASVMPGADLEKAFLTITKLLLDHFQCDRCYIMRLDTERNLIYPAEESCADGIEPILSKMNLHPLFQKEHWFQRLKKLKWIDFDVEASVQMKHEIGEWGIWTDYVRHAGVKRFYSIPIYFSGKLWGNWGMTYERKNVTLSERSLNLLVSVGRMLELVLVRQNYVIQLAKAVEQAESATRAKSAFLSTMSHELRTPLNSVIGYSDLLSDANVSQREMVEYASGINHSSNVLVNLINDLLDFSKLEANQMQIVTAPTDLHLMFHELSAVFQLSASAKGVLLRFHIRPELPLLYLDELRIRQILMNLIGNAVKYTPAGSIDVTAEYGADHTLSLIVADTGFGVEPTAQKIIFEPFTQQDAVRDTKIFKGTGLGLAIVKTLVEKMRGHIDLRSEVDKGSTFSVVIPTVEPFSDVVPVLNGDEYTVDTSLKILLVDDVPMNINLFEKMLAKLNVDCVHKAYSAVEALAILEEHSVDLIFTDMLMPEVDGLELAEKIRSNKKYDAIDIYLVTADVDARISAAEKFFSGVLLKPITLKDIKKAVSVKRKTTDK